MNSYRNVDIVFMRDTNRTGSHLGLPQENGCDARITTGTRCAYT